jgi:type VI secretion system protein ImpB
MADGSVAPKERVNIVYKSNTGDQSEDVELPLKLLMIGDYMGKEQDTVLEERDPVNVNKENFDDVMKGMNLKMNLNVKNTLTDDAEPVPVEIKVNSMNDFSPESVAKQVPELNSLLQMRGALLALKGPLGNVPAFRKTIQNILNDDDSRSQMMAELGLDK